MTGTAGQIGRMRHSLRSAVFAKRSIVVAVLLGAVIFAIPSIYVLRPVADRELAMPPGGITITDRHGIVLRSTRGAAGADSRWVPYSQIDPDLINAFVATEDHRFWDHPGVDLMAVARAARSNIRARRVVSGASTITMQLARLMRPGRRGLTGKGSEALLAIRLEVQLSKQQILEQYLNRIHLGQGTIGVAAASELYFGASPSEVSTGQAALLAGLAHAPSRDNPHASTSQARKARATALRRMQAMRLLTDDEVARAQAEPAVAGSRRATFLAPHFTTRVLSSYVGRMRSGIDTSESLQTSLDIGLQEVAEAEVRHTVDQLRDRGVAHAAAVILDNETGEILAWVGSPDFWATQDGQTDMVLSARQPGSALKPFLYGLALDRGYTAASVLADIPTTYATATGAYQPRNYDRRFRGPVRIREALASSYNVPAVELAAQLSAASLLRTLRLAGFASLSRDATHYGLGLALGNGDVTLLELANAYRALASGGAWRPWTWEVNRITPESRQVISPMASAIVLDMLSDPVARIPGFGIDTPFDFPFPVAVKTGTSRHFTDNWAIGATKGFTVAVWAGNFSGRPMEGVSGVAGAGPLLHRLVMATAGRVAPGVLPSPGELGAVRVSVCRLSGMKVAHGCASMEEWFAPGTASAQLDTWERGGRVTLPVEFAEWQQSGLGAESVAAMASNADSATSQPAQHDSEADRPGPGLRIVSPRDGDRFSVPPGVDVRFATIPLRVVGANGVVQWTVDGRPHRTTRWTLVAGEHLFEVAGQFGETARVRVIVDP